MPKKSFGHHVIHHSRSWLKRGLFSFGIIGVVMAVGTVGFHTIENVPWLKSFYYMSMIATAQGPLYTPESDAGLIFVSVMSFISVGVCVAALGFIFGPFFGQLWKIGVEKLEEEAQHLRKGE